MMTVIIVEALVLIAVGALVVIVSDMDLGGNILRVILDNNCSFVLWSLIINFNN